jgi:hypothetical protein
MTIFLGFLFFISIQASDHDLQQIWPFDYLDYLYKYPIPKPIAGSFQVNLKTDAAVRLSATALPRKNETTSPTYLILCVQEFVPV